MVDRAETRTEDREGATPSTFDDLFDAHYERLLRTLWVLTGDAHEAEDLAQEAFARVFERQEQLSAGGNPAGYIYRTALNLHRSRRRRASVAIRRRGTLAPSGQDPLERVEDRDLLRRALAALSLKEREAVVLVVLLDMSDEDAAAILRTTPGAIRTRLSRAKAHLRAIANVEVDDVR